MSDNKKLVEEQQQEIKDLKAQLSALRESGSENERGSELESDNKRESRAHSEEIKALQDMLLEKTNEIANTSEELRILQTKVQQLQEECDRLRDQNSALADELKAKEETDKVSFVALLDI